MPNAGETRSLVEKMGAASQNDSIGRCNVFFFVRLACVVVVVIIIQFGFYCYCCKKGGKNVLRVPFCLCFKKTCVPFSLLRIHFRRFCLFLMEKIGILNSCWRFFFLLRSLYLASFSIAWSFVSPIKPSMCFL